MPWKEYKLIFIIYTILSPGHMQFVHSATEQLQQPTQPICNNFINCCLVPKWNATFAFLPTTWVPTSTKKLLSKNILVCLVQFDIMGLPWKEWMQTKDRENRKLTCTQASTLKFYEQQKSKIKKILLLIKFACASLEKMNKMWNRTEFTTLNQ